MIRRKELGYLTEIVCLEGPKHGKSQHSELPVLTPDDGVLNLEWLYAFPPTTLLDVIHQQRHLLQLVLVQEVSLAPGRLSVLHRVSAAEVTSPLLAFPLQESSEDCQAVAEAAISPEKLALVRLHPLVKGRRKYGLPTQPRCNHSGLLQVFGVFPLLASG